MVVLEREFEDVVRVRWSGSDFRRAELEIGTRFGASSAKQHETMCWSESQGYFGGAAEPKVRFSRGIVDQASGGNLPRVGVVWKNYSLKSQVRPRLGNALSH